jgi:hypothetical protein
MVFSIVMCLTSMLLLTACEGAKPFCKSDQDCAATCASFGHPIDGARCQAGRCSCLLPDADQTELDAEDALTELDESADLLDEEAADVEVDKQDEHDEQDDEQDQQALEQDEQGDEQDDEQEELVTARCPEDMVDRGSFCIDPFEAPNRADALPFVMFSFYEAEQWCAARGKRLCYDDEWTQVCAGEENWSYPYHPSEHEPGVCNDEQLWRAYNQDKLNGWPWSLGVESFESLEQSLALVREMGAAASVAADHVWALYQGEGSGSNPGCTHDGEVFDLLGNVEEWTRRRDGGDGPDFSGSLKGRYWSESRTCQSAVKTHGNSFRFYEIGFRCCADPALP